MKQSKILAGATAVCISVVATTAGSQGVRDTDTILSGPETTDALSGQVIEFFDGSEARYGSNGSYTYRYEPEGPAFTGVYTAADGGLVCVEFSNGFDRCDTFVVAGSRLILVIEDGTRYPVRDVSPIPD